MILPIQYRCDSPGCQAVRTPTNHWYFVEDKTCISIWKWEDAVAKKDLDCGLHFCGQAHALQHVSSLMGK